MVAKWGFVKAESDLRKYVSKIKIEFHPRLRDNHLLILWRADIDFGHIAMAQVVPPLFRFLTQTDAIVVVHKGVWEGSLNEQQKAYFIDHALSMISASDKYMDDGRPKLVTVQPEKVGFASVIRRHGMVTKELEQYQTAFTETLQLDIFEMMRDTFPESFAYAGYNSNDAVTERKFGTVGFNTQSELELFIQAARVVMSENKANALLLQLHLNINYPTATMIMDSLIEAKFITPFDAENGGHRVLGTEEMLLAYQDATLDAAAGEADDLEDVDDEMPPPPPNRGVHDNVVHLAR